MTSLEERLERLESLFYGAPVVRRSEQPSICLITPAWKRHELTRVCLAQRRWLATELAKAGIYMETVVIADDENLDVAREFGFETVEMDNQFLGRKFNAGYRFAGSEGYEYAMPMGSDSWVLPDLFYPVAARLPRPGTLLCSRSYLCVHSSGTRAMSMTVQAPFGVSYIVPMEQVAAADFTPCTDEIARACDTHTNKGLKAATPDLRLTFQEQHPLEHVGFQTGGVQVTNYDKLKRVHRGREVRRPLDELEGVYPDHLVQAIRTHYGQ